VSKAKTLPVDFEILDEVSRTFGTPTYLYDEHLLRQKCRDLKQLFTGLPVRWLYAIKANDNPHLLKIIRLL